MEHYRFILDVGVILLVTKLLSMLTKRVNMPQVVGALVAGLLLGPACLNFVDNSVFIQNVAALGVIVLMFEAGLSTNMGELKRSGAASLIIAITGVLIPLAGGWLLGTVFPLLPGDRFLENLFLGVILTATSVSITVETLKEMGKLSTRTGNAILGAALIDDVLGIVALTIVSGMADSNVNLKIVLVKITCFFALSVIFGFLFHFVFQRWMNSAAWDRKRFAVIGLAFGFLYAFIAEAFFCVADITGAYIAGLILSTTSRAKFISSRTNTLSYMLLSPIFFASIGLQVQITSLDSRVLVFTLLLIIIAILTKVAGCGMGAKLCGFSNRDSLRVGVGMTTRGEVGLVIADKGLSNGVLNTVYLTPVILMVTVIAVITPVFLKIAYQEGPDELPERESDTGTLSDSYEAAHTISEVSDRLFDMNADSISYGFDAESELEWFEIEHSRQNPNERRDSDDRT